MLKRVKLIYSGILILSGLMFLLNTSGCLEVCTDEDGDGFCAEENDCNDTNPAINSLADEACDGVDNNCDGLIDEECQCVAEICNDELDNDCDGLIDEDDEDCKQECIDNDGDGYGEGCEPGPDCDDTDSSIYENCEQCIDNDGDGYGEGCEPGPDCNDTDSSIYENCEECTSNNECERGEYCQFADGECGGNGQCVPMLDYDCDAISAIIPVCGCDNQTYQHPCYMEQAGISKLHDGDCVCSPAIIDSSYEALGDCSTFEVEPDVTVVPYNNYIIASYNAILNSCIEGVETNLAMDLNGNIIITHEEIVPNPCRCVSPYRISVVISVCSPGTYTINIQDEDYTVEVVGICEPEQCNDELDNDCDGLVDAEDSDCVNLCTNSVLNNKSFIKLDDCGANPPEEFPYINVSEIDYNLYLIEWDEVFNSCIDDINVNLSYDENGMMILAAEEVTSNPCDCESTYRISAVIEICGDSVCVPGTYSIGIANITGEPVDFAVSCQEG